jgi:hypothetical protein
MINGPGLHGACIAAKNAPEGVPMGTSPACRVVVSARSGILTRDAKPAASVKDALIERVRELGYDTSMLRMTQHG